jgi:hypothetical protein
VPTTHTATARYPAAAATVLKMMTDRKFHERKLAAQDLTSYRILEHDFDGQDFRIRIERKVPVQAPGMIKKAAGSETTVVSEETWNVATGSGRIVVTTQGMPVEMSCEVSLADDGGDSIYSQQWTVSARIPVVGGTIERFIVSDIGNRAAEETRIATEILLDYR